MNSARQCLRTSIRRISSTKIKTGNPPPPKKPPLQNISRNHHTLLRQPPFHQFLARHPPRRPVAHGRAPESRRHLSDRPHFDPTPHLGSPEPSPSLSQRLRRLTREYGWSAVGVYLALSALDFPFCYLAVRWVGPETVGRWESVILAQLRKGLEVLPFGPAAAAPENPQEAEGGETKTEGSTRVVGSGEDEVEVRARQKGDQASLWTQLALAYAIHKSLLIFLRVPLTAALTPKVVKVLRGWGYDIGKRRPKPVESGSLK
ncbi:MAG: hypothetical protein LQ348_007165 [Seirophora lacunosa]|nr:MAG: hypothetical protein LQ348_007165 [Seirophora lacunosa]